MIETIPFLALGFVFGIAHAFEPDHVAAMSLFADPHDHYKTALKRGAYWGAGHTAVLFLVSTAVILFRINMPLPLSHYFEFAVGIMLIILGLRTLIIHRHPPHGLHMHIRPVFFVGMLHGLAGSAAFLLLILASTQSVILSFFYIIFFGIGLTVSMSFFTLLISKLQQKAARISQMVKVVSGLLAIAIGLNFFRPVLEF